MKIQINTDKTVSGDERLEEYLNSLIGDELARFSDQITRIEVYLSDSNGSKKGENDIHCTLECRLENLNPIAVKSQANTIERVVKDALGKLKSSIEKIEGSLRNY